MQHYFVSLNYKFYYKLRLLVSSNHLRSIIYQNLINTWFTIPHDGSTIAMKCLLHFLSKVFHTVS